MPGPVSATTIRTRLFDTSRAVSITIVPSRPIASIALWI